MHDPLKLDVQASNEDRCTTCKADMSYKIYIGELENANAALKSENDHLRTIVRTLKANVAELERKLQPKPLHVIALRHVFAYLSPPPGMYDSAIFRGLESPWCTAIRMLKSLALVCKSWHAAALPFLYRDVVLRRAGQLVAFTKTVQDDPETFARLIHGLTISCTVPKSLFVVARSSLVTLLTQCTRLQSISFQTWFPLQSILDYKIGTSSSACAFSLPPTLVSLGLCDDESATLLNNPSEFIFKSPFLSSVQQLTSLSIHAKTITPDLRDSQIVLPRLESLTFWSHSEAHYGDPSFRLVLSLRWSFPALRALRFRPWVNSWISYQAVLQFCEKHGAALLELDFGRHYTAPSEHQPMHASYFDEQIDVTESCPMLKRLVMTVHAMETDDVIKKLRNSEVFKRPIDVVDLVCADYPSGLVSQGDQILTYHEGSAWVRVRYWDWRLLREVPNLPQLLLAQDPSSPKRHVREFHGLLFQQQNGMFYVSPVQQLECATDSEFRRLLCEDSWQSSSESGSETQDEFDSQEGSSVYEWDDAEIDPRELESGSEDSEQLTEDYLIAGDD